MSVLAPMLPAIARARTRVLVGWLGCASVAIAQEKDDPDPLPPPPVFLEALRGAYRDGPIGEHVRITVEDSLGRKSVRRLKLYLDADPAARDPSLRIEFDPLEVWWGGGELVAVTNRNETVYYSMLLPGPPDLPTMSSALRPLPLPQLQLAFSADRGLSLPTPYTPHTVWTVARLADAQFGRGEVVEIEGMSGGREVRLWIDPRSDRLIRLRAQIGPPEDPAALTLEIECRAFDPPAPSGWRIDTIGRWPVTSIVDLQPRRPPVRVGDLTPEIELFDGDTMPWRLSTVLAESSGEPEGRPHALALILFRHDADEQMQDGFLNAAGSAIRAIDVLCNRALAPPTDERLVEPGRTHPWRLAVHAGVVFDLGDYSPLRYRELAPRWDEQFGAPGTLLWDHSPSRSIGWFDDAAGALLILVGPDRTLLMVEPLDPDSDHAALADRIDAALRLAHPPQSIVAPDTTDESGGPPG